MRWWGRLLISMDNLTYFLWFWTAFFWNLGSKIFKIAVQLTVDTWDIHETPNITLFPADAVGP